MIQNWKIRDLIVKVYSILREHCNHPYNKVRHQIGKILAALAAFDINMYPHQSIQNGMHTEVNGNATWNMSSGFPTKQGFIQEMLPKLSLNFHNPGLEGIVLQNGNIENTLEGCGGGGGIIVNNGKADISTSPNTSTTSITEVDMMEVDEDSIMDDINAVLPLNSGQNMSSGVLAALTKAVKIGKSSSGNIVSFSTINEAIPPTNSMQSGNPKAMNMLGDSIMSGAGKGQHSHFISNQSNGFIIVLLIFIVNSFINCLMF